MRVAALSGIVLLLLAALALGCSTTIDIVIRPGDASADGSHPGSDGGDARAPHAEGGPGDAGHDAVVDGGGGVVTGLTVGGTVTGLLGKSLELQDDGFDDLPIAKDGPFTFPAHFSTGGTYSVMVLAEPTSPAQTCTISGGTGTFGTSDVTNVVVTCSTDAFTIGGTLSGLSGTVVLRDNGGDDLMLSADGAFTFSSAVASGSSYAVTVYEQPAGHRCTVADGDGVVASADVTSVSVTCKARKYTVGGTVSGLTGSGLVLKDNGSDALTITKAGAFTFPKALANGSAYSVTVSSQPGGQYCTVTDGSGTIAGADVTTVDVTCATPTPYTIGGTVSGLATGDSVVLQDNLTDDLTVSANGSFTFATSILQGSTYSVSVLTNPSTPPEYCSVSSGAGTVTTGDVTSVVVTCSVSGCGRFTSGYAGSWSTVSANPLPTGMGMSGCLPAGGPATLYLNDGPSFDQYATSTDTYTLLATPPISFPSYGSTAWFGGAVWAVASGSVIRYDLTAGTWSTPATGLTVASATQTTVDDAGNLWSLGSASSLFEYDTATGTTTYPTVTGFASFSEPRITYDSCSGLLYVTDYDSTTFYSYDPSSGTQVLLSSLPGGNTFQDGFCGDHSGHIFAVTNTSTMYQYTISSGVWAAMPSGGPTGTSNSACGVGADGYLYATDPATSSTMYRIELF